MKNLGFLGCRKSPYDGRDYLVSTLVEDVIKNLPTKCDITDKMTPVQDQGQEGSCVGFSGVAIKEYQEQIDYGKFIRLSERFLYERSKDISGHNEGTTLKACAQVLVKQGVCEQRFWKYEAQHIGEPEEGADENASKYKIEPAYVRITNEAELKASLVKYGAIHLGVAVCNTWKRQQNGHIPDFNWFENLLFYFGIGILGGHAITLVGYDDEKQEYKFKNSWSTVWGDEGYGYITYTHMKKTLLDALCYIDIDDPDDWKEMPIKRVCNLTRKERKHAWV